MSNRKLATLREISALVPIPGADNIECAIIDGWQVVVKKGEFEKKDICVYFEIDSVLPEQPRYEFLRKSCFIDKYGFKGFRLKTIKLRKQISQGLALPLSAFEEEEIDLNLVGQFITLKEPVDITEVLGVVKYEKPLDPKLVGKAKGSFPSFIPKTDQERVQNCINRVIKYASTHHFEATLKLDGSSLTIYKTPEKLGVCSRNLELDPTDESNSFVKIFLSLKPFLEEMKETNFALQGELMGPGVQGNREGFNNLEYYLYDIFDINTQKYLSADMRHSVFRRLKNIECPIKHVPVLSYLSGQIFVDKYTNPNTVVDCLLLASKINSINHPIAEGIVYKSIQDPSISFKVINNEYLLKEE